MRFFDHRFRLLGWQGLVGMAVSGIDMAVWDALGRAMEQPVAVLLGASPKPIVAYDSCSVIDPKADVPALEASIQRGFRAIKIKLGDGGLEEDVAIVSVVRDVIGPDVKLMVDYNQALDAPGSYSPDQGHRTFRTVLGRRAGQGGRLTWSSP